MKDKRIITKMLNIGICKFGKKMWTTKLHRNGVETGYLFEKMILDTLKEKYKFYILHNVEEYEDVKKWNGEQIDKILVIGGPLIPDNTKLNMFLNTTQKCIDISNQFTSDIFYYTSDSNFFPDIISTNNFNRGIKRIFREDDDKFSKMILLYLTKDSSIKKDILISFIGGNRGRIKYVRKFSKDCNYNIHLYGKNWQPINEKTIVHDQINFKDSFKIYERTKYSIYFPDKEKIKRNWVTDRYWQCLFFDIILFCHIDIDRLNKQYKQNDFRIFKDFKELNEKITLLENSPELYNKLLQIQREELKEEYFDKQYWKQYILEVFNFETL